MVGLGWKCWQKSLSLGEWLSAYRYCQSEIHFMIRACLELYGCNVHNESLAALLLHLPAGMGEPESSPLASDLYIMALLLFTISLHCIHDGYSSCSMFFLSFAPLNSY